MRRNYENASNLQKCVETSTMHWNINNISKQRKSIKTTTMHQNNKNAKHQNYKQGRIYGRQINPPLALLPLPHHPLPCPLQPFHPPLTIPCLYPSAEARNTDFCVFQDKTGYEPTERPTVGRTDRQDKPSYRGARMHVKSIKTTEGHRNHRNTRNYKVHQNYKDVS